MTTSKPKPAKNKPFNLTLSPELRAWVEERARATGMSNAAFVRFTLLSAKARIELSNKQ